MARSQHGVVTRKQLHELGFSREAIEHRLRRGRLHQLARGVYLVGWPQLTDERRWMAAVLACGEGAALSHRRAAALWGIAKETPGHIEVSVRRRCKVRRAGVRVRSRPSLSAADVGERRSIPLTSIAQTLVDLATELPAGPLERAVNEADKGDLIDPEALRQALTERVGRTGR